MMTQDTELMRYALQLAKLGEYSARPNPCVGCVIVKDNQIVGEGAHWQAGTPHAEIHALNQAKDKAQGATCYVTLEPCAHSGRTGPCIEAVIASQVSRVVIASQDPNPLTSGKGIQALKAAGIEVTVGVLESEAKQLNVGFFSRMLRRQPYIRAKMAMSLDGRVAMKNGQSQWITSENARKKGHEWRAKSGAILTGSGTVKQDNCRLTVRHLDALSLPQGIGFQQPLRVVVDSQLTLKSDSAIFAKEGPVVIACHSTSTRQEIPSHVEYIALPSQTEKVDLTSLLFWLAEREINDVLVEAGPTLVGAMLEQGLVDELLLFIAPKLLGSEAKPLAYLPKMQHLEDHIGGEFSQVAHMGPDLFITVKLSDFARQYHANS